jgi:hypothetical protein
MNNKLILRKLPTVAPRGKQKGVYAEVIVNTGKNKLGQPYNDLIVAADLEQKDPLGKPYRIEKKYNLEGRARGLAAFQADFESAQGRSLTDEELDAFDPDTLLKGKPVIVEIKHRKEGKKIVAYIDGFFPAEVAAQPTA